MPVTRGPAPGLAIVLPQDHPIVQATSMLDWKSMPAANGIAQSGLDLFKAVRAFLGRCSLSHNQADQTRFNQTSFLQFDLSDAAWERIIDEYVDSELPEALLDIDARSLSQFDDAVKALSFSDPNNVILEAADLHPRESFDDPGRPVAAARRGGRGGAPAAQPAAPPVPGPADLAFLNVCTISLLVDTSSPESPLRPLAMLAGMIGPYSTRDVRRLITSTIQLTSALIRQQLSDRFGCSADGARAVNLKDFVLDTYLPSPFAALVASEEELRREARDACSYRRSAQGRIDVEISRLHYLRARCPYLSCVAHAWLESTLHLRVAEAWRSCIPLTLLCA